VGEKQSEKTLSSSLFSLRNARYEKNGLSGAANREDSDCAWCKTQQLWQLATP
jgi:hypothetical protein